MASFCCSCPSESMPVLMLLTECLKYLPHETSELIAEVQLHAVEFLGTVLSLLTCLQWHSGGYEPIIELSRRLCSVQKDLGLQWEPARQMGFKDRRIGPDICRLASEYISKYEGFEDDIYAYFENEPDADSLYVKLVEEFERCILSYFGFHFNHCDILISQAERDGSNEYADYQPGSLNTTDQLIKDLDNFDIVFHIGDLPYANGYISQWDHGNHERDWPNTGSFFNTLDSGGECGVPAETMYYYPAENKAKFWYATDYGMFRFCIADSEHDWREGSEQYKFIENCLATVDRKQQPWLIFAAHRPLGYSSNSWYAMEGSFEEPMGGESLQGLWQKYKVDIAFYGHVHNYERVCPIYQNQCVNKEKYHYSGTVNGTIHVVVGGGGSHLSDFTASPPVWSIFRDRDYGFGKLTAFNHSYLLFEYPSMYSRKGFTTICQFAINFV
ncbi:hypothetical protein RYX36_034446 [Vicia faba]